MPPPSLLKHPPFPWLVSTRRFFFLRLFAFSCPLFCAWSPRDMCKRAQQRERDWGREGGMGWGKTLTKEVREQGCRRQARYGDYSTGARYCSHHCNSHHRNLKTSERYLPLPPPPRPRTRARASKGVFQAALDSSTQAPTPAPRRTVRAKPADGTVTRGSTALPASPFSRWPLKKDHRCNTQVPELIALRGTAPSPQDDSVEVSVFEDDARDTATGGSSEALRDELLRRFPELQEGGIASVLAQEACESDDERERQREGMAVPLFPGSPSSRLHVSAARRHRQGQGASEQARVAALKRELAEHGINDTSTKALLARCLSLVKQRHH